MSAEPYSLVNLASAEDLSAILAQLKQAIETNSTVFCQGEVNEGEHNAIISKLVILTPAVRKVFIIDIQKIGKTAFGGTKPDTASLQAILQDSKVIKVFFDVRNVCNALYYQFDVTLCGVEDIQLLELASRPGCKDLLASLDKCVDDENASVPPICIANARNQHLIHKVAHLPSLYRTYRARLAPMGESFWRSYANYEQNKRLEAARKPSFDVHSKDNVRGPWSKCDIEMELETWNDDVLSAHYHGEDIPEWDDMFDGSVDDEGSQDLDDLRPRDFDGWEEHQIALDGFLIEPGRY